MNNSFFFVSLIFFIFSLPLFNLPSLPFQSSIPFHILLKYIKRLIHVNIMTGGPIEKIEYY